MPKDLFHNLPADKQKRIVDAALQEFVEYKDDYSKASVKRIAKNAGIAIGSIYLYFKDKNDIFFYLLEQSKPLVPFQPDSNTLAERTSRPLMAYAGENNVYRILIDILLQNEDLYHAITFDYFQLSTFDICQYLENDKARGLLRDDVDIEQAAYLYSVMDYISYRYCKKKQLDSAADMGMKFLNMFLYGIYINK